jgi:hypothetical protein
MLVLACKAYDPLYCDESKPCTDPERPYCDLSGEYEASEGIARTCIPEPSDDFDAGTADEGDGDGAPGPDASFCTAGEFLQCTDDDTAIYCNDQGSELITIDCDSECNPDKHGCFCEPDTSSCANNQTVHCASNGTVQEIEDCFLGCNQTGERCVDVNPSNGLAGYLDMTDDAPVVVLSNGAVIDTDAGTLRNGDGTLVQVPEFQVTAPSGGVPIRVFAVKSVTFGDITIDGSRAAAVVADGDIVIQGRVRIWAGEMTSGNCLGGPQLCEGDLVPAICSGGGGGGFGGSGNRGGHGIADGVNLAGGSGGFPSGNASLVPLRGGCAGGPFVGNPSEATDGGAGGGALQLVSRTRIIRGDPNVPSHLNAGGEGGDGLGQGAGSGGGILLEAPRVALQGTGIYANGGGGGCYMAPGEDGRASTTQALGGSNTQSNAFDGGDGATFLAPPGIGETANCATGCFAGGGGGGVGRIRVNVPSAVDFSGGGSPTASIGTLATR